MRHFANNADYYDALKRITQYASVEQLRRKAEKLYGIPAEEAIEYDISAGRQQQNEQPI